MLDAEQIENARIIIEVGRSRGVSERGIAIALATGMVESWLRNLDWGDRDSLGLFQQRPSTGWGTEDEVRDPYRAAAAFFGGPDLQRPVDLDRDPDRQLFPDDLRRLFHGVLPLFVTLRPMCDGFSTLVYATLSALLYLMMSDMICGCQVRDPFFLAMPASSSFRQIARRDCPLP